MRRQYYEFEWVPVPYGFAPYYKCLISYSGYPMPFDTGYLPPGFEKMPGLYLAYISGLCGSLPTISGVTGYGELCVWRFDAKSDKNKLYTYPIACSGNDVLYGPEYKWFNGHHFGKSESLPANLGFGNIPWPPCTG